MHQGPQIKNLLPTTIWVCLCFLFFGCEKDDICNEGTPGTPKLVIRFYDQENPTETKGLPGIKIQYIAQEYPLYELTSSDSIALPMDLSTNATRYAFILPTSTASLTVADTLQFNHHMRIDEYTRRACGYKASFQLIDPPVSTTNSASWFIRAEILTDTISNEEQAHLAIYH